MNAVYVTHTPIVPGYHVGLELQIQYMYLPSLSRLACTCICLMLVPGTNCEVKLSGEGSCRRI